MRWTGRAVAVALLAGCGVGPQLTGSDPLPNNTDAPQTVDGPLGTELCPVSDLEAACGAPGRSLTATVDTDREPPVVDIVHAGVDVPGCEPWAADARPNEDGDVINVVYTPGATATGDTSQACDCAWTFTYWVQLRPGTYTISALGDTARVTVPTY